MRDTKSRKFTYALAFAGALVLSACGQDQETSQSETDANTAATATAPENTASNIGGGAPGSGEPVSPYTTGDVGAASSVPSDPSTPPAEAVTPPGVAGTPGTAGTAANPSPAVTSGDGPIGESDASSGAGAEAQRSGNDRPASDGAASQER